MIHRTGVRIVFISLVLGVFLVGSCSKDHDPVAYKNPIDTGDISVPPVPYHLVAQVGDQTVALRWEVSDTADVRWYRIARQDSLAGKYISIDSVAQTNYCDHRLKNNRIYRYRVCVINSSGYVGSYSSEISVVPSGFGISIDGGQEYTNTRSVILSISAPGGASFIVLAHDSLFAGVSWEPFVNQKDWTLTAGDGLKAVFLKARDLDDNETTEIYRDDIILDTRASISNLTFLPQDSVLSPGEVIHFAMVTGETLGQASVDINTVAINKKLYDDGTHGDLVADDGCYELDFLIPSGLEVIDAVIRGRFIDLAGNSAEEVASVPTLTIQQVPQAVQLFPPSSFEDQQTMLHLAWSRNQDADFSAYRLYRSETPGVMSAPDKRLVADIPNQATTSYDDDGLKESTTYYYQLSVYDDYGLFSSSNEVSGTTGENQEPESVTLLITAVELMPGDSSAAQIELKWTRNQEVDFDHYVIYRDQQSPVSMSSTPIDLINERETNSMTDALLQLSTRYYYRVYVCDEGGLCGSSNEVNATTPTGP